MPTAAKEYAVTGTDLIPSLRELAHRNANGIDVSLIWDADADRAFVLVLDEVHGTAFHVEVEDANPMDVFHHPYVYVDQELAA
jgi:hypothetical protein